MRDHSNFYDCARFNAVQLYDDLECRDGSLKNRGSEVETLKLRLWSWDSEVETLNRLRTSEEQLQRFQWGFMRWVIRHWAILREILWNEFLTRKLLFVEPEDKLMPPNCLHDGQSTARIPSKPSLSMPAHRSWWSLSSPSALKSLKNFSSQN